MDQSNPQKALGHNIEGPTQNTALHEVPYPFNRETHYDELLLITPPNKKGDDAIVEHGTQSTRGELTAESRIN
jgi:hypothetical protein